jgi:serine/threonine protein phosphatase PrpC
MPSSLQLAVAKLFAGRKWHSRKQRVNVPEVQNKKQMQKEELARDGPPARAEDVALIASLGGIPILDCLPERLAPAAVGVATEQARPLFSRSTSSSSSVGIASSTEDLGRQAFASKALRQCGDRSLLFGLAGTAGVTDAGPPGKKEKAQNGDQSTGGQLDAIDHALGFVCQKGLKPRIPNQDSWLAMRVEPEGAAGGFSVYGVFDGHGERGHEISLFVKDMLPKIVLRDRRFASDELRPVLLEDAFAQMQGLIISASQTEALANAWTSGTTCTVVVHDHERNDLTIAHVGDSAAVIGRYTGPERTELEAVELTRDHRPASPSERTRIEQNGGCVLWDGYRQHRVYKPGTRRLGLNMSRSLGDIMGHVLCGLSAEPELGRHEVGPDDRLLLVCSDGIWEVISPAEAVDIVGKFEPAEAMVAAEVLAREARTRWLTRGVGTVVDDITVLVQFLPDPEQRELECELRSGATVHV